MKGVFGFTKCLFISINANACPLTTSEGLLWGLKGLSAFGNCSNLNQCRLRHCNPLVNSFSLPRPAKYQKSTFSYLLHFLSLPTYTILLAKQVPAGNYELNCTKKLLLDRNTSRFNHYTLHVKMLPYKVTSVINHIITISKNSSFQIVH